MRSTLAPVILVVLAAGSGVAACSSFGETAAPAGDVVDAKAPLPDGGDAGETGADAGEPPACPADAFCDSFERDDTKGAWGFLSKPSGKSTLAITSSTRVSGARSLVAVAGDAIGSAFVERPMLGADGVDVAFALKLDHLPGPGVTLCQVVFETSTAVSIVIDGTGIKVTEQVTGTNSGGYAQSEQAPIALDAWVPLFFRIDGADATLEAPTATPPMRIRYPIVNPITRPKLVRLGIPYTPAQSTAPHFWFDDVVIR